jgi:ABC-type multidrug transport system fused ATPase/permease subunit
MAMPDGLAAEQDAGRFDMTRLASCALVISAAAATAARTVAAVGAARSGDLGPSEGFSFTVIFPLVLLTLIFWLGPDRTREGVLMRIGTACQLILMIAAPSLALHLLLGLPVVFLLVEWFETRSPALFRAQISGLLVTC